MPITHCLLSLLVPLNCFPLSVFSSCNAGKEKEDEAKETREKVSVYIKFSFSVGFLDLNWLK